MKSLMCFFVNLPIQIVCLFFSFQWVCANTMTEDCMDRHLSPRSSNFSSPQSSQSLASNEMMLSEADHAFESHPLASRRRVLVPSSTASMKPISDLVPNSLIRAADLFGPIPNLFKWLQCQMNSIEQYLVSSQSPSSHRQSPPPNGQMIDIAMTKEEQNLEIVYQNGQYYFEALHSFRVSLRNTFASKDNLGGNLGDAKPKAWLSKEIESKLALKPGKSFLNGQVTYYCVMCNQFGPYSNQLLLHMILTCPKLGNSSGRASPPTSADRQSLSKDSNNNGLKSTELCSPNKCTAKRSFDIMSLLDNAEPIAEYSRISSDDNEDSDEKIDVESLEEPDDNTFRLMKPISQAAHQAANYESFNGMNGNARKAGSHRAPSKHNRAGKSLNSNLSPFPGSTRQSVSNKPAKNGQVNSRQPKSAFKKLKVPEAESLDLASFRKGPENVVPNLMPNLANLYTQFGSSLFANTFASFLQQSSGVNPPPPHTQAPNSLSLGSMDHAFPPNYPTSNLFPPNCHLGPMRSPPLDSLPPKFLSHVSASSSVKVSPPMSSAVPYQGRSQPVHSFDLLSNQSPLSIGPNSLLTSSSLASNSPGSLSDSSSNNSSSRSPSISISAGSNDYEPKSRTNGQQAKESKASGKKKTRDHSSVAGDGSPATGSNLSLPPYFLPPSSTSSNPLISSMYLLSPSLTALSYQASNVCAYCNTAFRMTSDLVYHMRSHHKTMVREQESSSKKRRNDALKCNICQETFRERHHLTRHMTSHQ